MGTETESRRLESDYIQRQPGQGIFQNAQGQRVVFLTDDFLTSLAHTLEERFGDSTGPILYQCGHAWGSHILPAFIARAEAEFGAEFENLNMSDMLEAWWKPLRYTGWGTWDHDFSLASKGMIVIDVFDSPMASERQAHGCHFYAGLFAQLFSALARRELACAEIQCRSQGADCCRFLVSTSKRVDAASYWRNDGASCDEILNRMRST